MTSNDVLVIASQKQEEAKSCLPFITPDELDLLVVTHHKERELDNIIFREKNAESIKKRVLMIVNDINLLLRDFDKKFPFVYVWTTRDYSDRVHLEAWKQMRKELSKLYRVREAIWKDKLGFKVSEIRIFPPEGHPGHSFHPVDELKQFVINWTKKYSFL